MKYVAKFLIMATLASLVLAGVGWIVMDLWNAVIPAAFVDSRTIDYPHAVGLLILSRLLFGGFRGRGGWHRGRHWRKWDAMTPEEREQFRSKRFRERGREADWT